MIIYQCGKEDHDYFRNADLILVMKNGEIVEQGSHEALLAANGVFADMYVGVSNQHRFKVKSLIFAETTVL